MSTQKHTHLCSYARVSLRNLDTGTIWEQSVRAELKITDLPVERQALEFLYSDSGSCFFMNPQTYDHVEVGSTMIGEQAQFLEPGMQIPVEFAEGRAVTILRLTNGRESVSIGSASLTRP
jgi:elongation factor P